MKYLNRNENYEKYNKHTNLKYIYIIILIVIISLIILAQYNQYVRLNSTLVASDTYYHAGITKKFIEIEGYSQTIPDSTSNSKITYNTQMYTFISILKIITGIDVMNLFSFLGFSILIILILLVFIIFKKKNNLDAILIVILLLSFNYFITRFNMNVPENYALLFLVATLYLMINHPKKLFLIHLFIVSYVHYHSRSLFVILLIYIPYLIINLKNIRIKRLFINYLLCFILLLPVLKDIFKAYGYYFLSFFNITTPWINLAPDKTIYTTLRFVDFISYFNALIPIIFFLAIVNLFFHISRNNNKSDKKKWIYIIMIISIVLIVLMRLELTGNILPPYRLITYLSIFCIFSFIIFNKKIFRDKNRTKIIFYVMLTIFMIFNLFVEYHGSSGLSHQDFYTIQYIDEHFDDYFIKLTYGAPYYAYLKNSDWSVEQKTFYKINNEQQLCANLTNFYNNSKFILSVTSRDYLKLKKENPDFFINYKQKKVYSTKDTLVLKFICD